MKFAFLSLKAEVSSERQTASRQKAAVQVKGLAILSFFLVLISHCGSRFGCGLSDTDARVRGGAIENCVDNSLWYSIWIVSIPFLYPSFY